MRIPPNLWRVGLAVSASSAAQAQRILDIGALPGTTNPTAFAISADGFAVTGHCFDPNVGYRAFRWTPAGGMRDLGTLPTYPNASGFAISADGSMIAGRCYSDVAARAFRWSDSLGMEDLGTLPSGGNAFASAISADGSVVAGSSGPPFISRAFRWTRTGGMQDLGTISDGSEATAMSADGSVVVGYSGNDTGFSRPIRWSAKNGWAIENLGVLPGGGWALATGVSGDGSVVVGISDGRGFRWTAPTGLQPLPLGTAFVSADPRDVSADGTIIVGTASPFPGQFRAVLWNQAAGILDLNTYLAALGVNLDDWVLMEGQGVSGNARAFLGRGMHRGAYRSFVAYLDPLPCYANCDGSTGSPVLNVNDFVCFQARFAADDPYADCDHVGGLNVNDFLCFQNQFAAGCP